MKINQIISEIDRRGFLKSLGALATSVAAGTVNAQSRDELSIVQRQYDWQFAEQLGGDKIIKIVPRETGGKVAITTRGRYFLMIPYNEIKHTLPPGWDKGPTDITLMRVPKEILGGNIVKPGAKKEIPNQDNSQSLRQSNLDRMQQIAEPSASYAGRIKARIKPNLIIPGASERLEETGSLTVEIRSNPDGTIISRKVVVSSGFRRLDDAVLKAIDRTEVLPRDVDGRVPSSISLTFNLKEF